MMNTVNNQKGLSLIELMVSMVAGLVVIGGVTTVFLSTLGSSGDALKQSKLNQELNALMTIMSNDIRRAGIWQSNIDYTRPQDNPFSSEGNTKLTVVDQTTGVTVNPFNTVSWNVDLERSGDCILYAYDHDTTAGLDNDDIFGFKLSNNAVLYRTAGVNTGTDNDLCTTGTWTTISDWRLIDITGLTFDLNDSACVNAEEPNGDDDDGNGTDDNDAEINCYVVPPSAGDVTTETRQVHISLTGNLIDDTMVQRTMQQTIRVRNDHVRETP